MDVARTEESVKLRFWRAWSPRCTRPIGQGWLRSGNPLYEVPVDGLPLVRPVGPGRKW